MFLQDKTLVILLVKVTEPFQRIRGPRIPITHEF